MNPPAHLRFPKLETIRTVIAAIAAMTLVISVLLLVFEVRDARLAQECRFDLSAEVNSIGDKIDQATARGLAALSRGDDIEVAQQAAIIDDLTDDLDPAISRRAQAIEICGNT